MKTITYFAGARSGNKPIYEQAAIEVGKFCGQYNCLAKYGASRHGLMGAFALSFIETAKQTGSGGKMLGIVPRKYSRINGPETLEMEHILTETLTERKTLLLEKADAFLVLPGGTGTLDEIYEAIEQDYLPVDRDPTYADYAFRPIFILNLEGYYDTTYQQLQYMIQEGFLIPQKIASLHFYDTTEAYLDALKRFFEG